MGRCPLQKTFVISPNPPLSSWSHFPCTGNQEKNGLGDVISEHSQPQILSSRESLITLQDICRNKSANHLLDRKAKKHRLGGVVELWDRNEVQLIENEIWKKVENKINCSKLQLRLITTVFSQFL